MSPSIFAAWPTWQGIAAVAFLASSGCASTGPFVWVKDLPASAVPGRDAPYVIDSGDMLDVRVYGDEKASVRARVRTDGRITMPLLGDVVARGLTPLALGQDIGQRLQKFLNAPTVTVGVDETHPLSITLVGEIAHTGVFPIAQNSGVLQALATAGGFTDLADRDRIFIVRKEPPMRIRFTYKALTSNDPAASSFTLMNGDVVAVE